VRLHGKSVAAFEVAPWRALCEAGLADRRLALSWNHPLISETAPIGDAHSPESLSGEALTEPGSPLASRGYPVWNPTVERLAQELKSLVGWGAKRHHVITRPMLRELVSSRYSDDKHEILSQAIIEELRRAADQLPEPEAECVRCLLMLARRWERTATARRDEVIERLQLGMSVETFRRPYGPELDLMRELAFVLVDAPDGGEALAG
jgi:hypothetical protein